MLHTRTALLGTIVPDAQVAFDAIEKITEQLFYRGADGFLSRR